MNWLQLSLLSAVFAGMVAIFAKLGMKDIDSVLATTARAIIMLGALLALSFSQGRLAQMLKFPPQTWLFVILAGLAGAASWLCYFQALKIGDASRVAPVDKLSTVVTVLMAAVFLHESLTWKVGIGSLLVVIGSFLVAL